MALLAVAVHISNVSAESGLDFLEILARMQDLKVIGVGKLGTCCLREV